MKKDYDYYREWKELVNMTSRELEDFMYSPDGFLAGMDPEEAQARGIKSGQESARWLLRMKAKPYRKWTDEEKEWMRRQVSFIKRMRGIKAPYYKNGKPTRLLLALKIWGHDPEKEW